MVRKRKYDVGDRIGKWLVLSRSGRKVTVQCECGDVHERYASNLTSGKSSACVKCAAKDFASHRTNGYDTDWDLTDEQAVSMAREPCLYCDDEPQERKAGTTGRVIRFHGLDRYDNKKGYVQGNVLPCCTKCNMMKKDMTYDDFIEQANKISSVHPTGSVLILAEAAHGRSV